MHQPQLYTVNQVTEILNIGRTATYDLIRTGRLQSVKIGALRRVPASAVDAFIQDISS